MNAFIDFSGCMRRCDSNYLVLPFLTEHDDIQCICLF